MITFFAGGFLFNPDTQCVLLHKRDGNTKVNPNRWAFFGGTSEPGETPVETFIREIHEEMGVLIATSEVISLTDYYNDKEQTHRHVFYVISRLEKDSMTLGEGAGFDWVSLEKLSQYNLTEKTVRDLQTFMSQLKA